MDVDADENEWNIAFSVCGIGYGGHGSGSEADGYNLDQIDNFFSKKFKRNYFLRAIYEFDLPGQWVR